MSQRNRGGARRRLPYEILVFAGLFVLLQYRMELLAALLPGGPAYDPAVHGEVVLITTTGCRFCASAKRYLADHEIPFTEYDIAGDPRGREVLAATGHYGVPVLLVGGEVVPGFDPLRIRRAFERVSASGRAGDGGDGRDSDSGGGARAQNP